MNRENVEKLLDHIKNTPSKQVRLNDWIVTKNKRSVTQIKTFKRVRKENECGTIACIAGHACLLMDEKDLKSDNQGHMNYIESMQKWLDLEERVNDQLFKIHNYKDQWDVKYDVYNCSDKQTAINRLTTLLETKGNDIHIYGEIKPPWVL